MKDKNNNGNWREAEEHTGGYRRAVRRRRPRPTEGRVPAEDVRTRQSGGSAEDEIYGRRAEVLPDDTIYGRRTGAMPVDDVYGRRTGAMPTDEVYIYSRRTGSMQAEDRYDRRTGAMPTEDLYGRPLGTIPADELYDRTIGALPNEALYGRRTGAMPVDDVYGRRTGAMPVDDVYGRRTGAMPVDDVYGRRTGAMPVDEVYGRRADALIDEEERPVKHGKKKSGHTASKKLKSKEASQGKYKLYVIPAEEEPTKQLLEQTTPIEIRVDGKTQNLFSGLTLPLPVMDEDAGTDAPETEEHKVKASETQREEHAVKREETPRKEEPVRRPNVAEPQRAEAMNAVSQGRPEHVNGYPQRRPEQPNGYPQGRPEHSNGYPQRRPEQPNGYPQGRPEHSNGYPQRRPEQPNGYPQGRPGMGMTERMPVSAMGRAENPHLAGQSMAQPVQPLPEPVADPAAMAMTEEKPKKRSVLRIIGDILFYFVMVALVLAVFIIKSSSDGAPISVGGYSMMYVLTSSMEDVIPKGSLIVTKSVETNELQIGDDITYLSGPSSTITHRIIEITENYADTGDRAFITQGTMNTSPDSQPVAAANVVGKVVFHNYILGQILQFIQEYWKILLVMLVLVIALIATLGVLLKKDPEEKALMQQTEPTEQRRSRRKKRKE